MDGGESGIRTHVRVSPKHAFQACAFSHSAISPAHFRKALLHHLNVIIWKAVYLLAQQRSYLGVRWNSCWTRTRCSAVSCLACRSEVPSLPPVTMGSALSAAP